MSMARSMGNNSGSSGSAPDTPLPAAGDTPDLSSLLGAFGDGGIDPKLLSGAMRLFGAYNKGGDPQKTALIQAVKPYLRPSRRDRVDKAMQTLKLASVAKEALGEDIFSSLLGGILGRK